LAAKVHLLLASKNTTFSCDIPIGSINPLGKIHCEKNLMGEGGIHPSLLPRVKESQKKTLFALAKK